QLRAAYKSATKGLVGATAGIHQLGHATDHLGGEPALISDRSSNISSQPHYALSQLLYLLLNPGNPLEHPRQLQEHPRWLLGAPAAPFGCLSGPRATLAHVSPILK
ncbi:hypothetical protein Tco_1529432, partial [Tanacetum coccineum]